MALSPTGIPGLQSSCWGGYRVTDEYLISEWACNVQNKLDRIRDALPPTDQATDVENYIRSVLDDYADEDIF